MPRALQSLRGCYLWIVKEGPAVAIARKRNLILPGTAVLLAMLLAAADAPAQPPIHNPLVNRSKAANTGRVEHSGVEFLARRQLVDPNPLGDSLLQGSGTGSSDFGNSGLGGDDAGSNEPDSSGLLDPNAADPDPNRSENSTGPSEELPPANLKPAAPRMPAATTPSVLSETPDGAWFSPEGEYEEPPPVCSSGGWLNDGLWYAQADFTYVHRQAGQDKFLLAVDGGTFAVFNQALFFPELAIDPGMGFAPGMRLTVGRFLGRDFKNRDHAMEFTFLGLNDWKQDGGLRSVNDNTITSVLDPARANGGFSSADFQTFTYSSEFNSFEMNYRLSRRLGRDQLELNRAGDWVRKCAPSLLPSFIAGIRYIEVDEGFEYRSSGNNPGSLVPVSGRYDVVTKNDMIGPQLGGDIFYQNCNWRVGARVKGGALVNFDEQTSDVSITAIVPQADRHEKASSNIASFAGEVNLLGAYQIRPNMALRFSADFIWLNQIATAYQQLAFTAPPTPQVFSGGSAFYQGASFGFEYVW